jgi:stage II sporulation protein AB (anti-sigma F factor)
MMIKQIYDMTITIPRETELQPIVLSIIAPLQKYYDRDIKNSIQAVVREAVQNILMHAYDVNEKYIKFRVMVQYDDTNGPHLNILIEDYGKGISDIKNALIPYTKTVNNNIITTIGFTIMKSFSKNFYLEPVSSEDDNPGLRLVLTFDCISIQNN